MALWLLVFARIGGCSPRSPLADKTYCSRLKKEFANETGYRFRRNSTRERSPPQALVTGEPLPVAVRAFVSPRTRRITIPAVLTERRRVRRPLLAEIRNLALPDHRVQDSRDVYRTSEPLTFFYHRTHPLSRCESLPLLLPQTNNSRGTETTTNKKPFKYTYFTHACQVNCQMKN